jgi:hypothetical protein
MKILKNSVFKHPDALLSTVLWLIAVHSIAMGMALITQPAILMEWSGFGSEYERFFPTQGGVFHLLMAVAYTMGAIDSPKYYYLIVFSIVVKAVATAFLLVYCFTVEFKWTFLSFGLIDGVMGTMIFIALRHHLYFQKTNRKR